MACIGQGCIGATKPSSDDRSYSSSNICSVQFFIITGVLLLTLVYLYRKIFIPFDYEQGISEDISDSIFGTSKSNARRDLARLSANLRKTGTKLPPPYPNGWFGVIESSKLNAGNVHRVDCLGECIAVYRTETGIARALDAHCPHLGANMAVGGTVKGDCLECPFHKWRFNGNTGRCVSIPDVETIPKGAAVRPWHVCEVDGMVFVWFHSEGGPPRWFLPKVEQINDNRWHYMGRNDFLIACHIQDIPENGADVAHLNAIHSDHLLAGKMLPTTDAWNGLGRHVWNGQWSVSETCQHEAVVSLKHEIKLLDKISLIGIDVTAKQIGPSYVQMLINHQNVSMVILQTVTPISPLVQRVIHRLYAPMTFKPLANLLMWSETVMFHRDVMVWNSKQYLNNPILVKTDRCLKAYRFWYKQFYSETSESFEDAVKKVGRNGAMDW